LGIFRPAMLGQIAERDEVQAVAARADLAINLETAPELVLVIGSENAGKTPVLHLGVRILLRGLRGGNAEGQRGGGQDAEESLLDAHYLMSPYAQGLSLGWPRTLSEMLAGS